MYKVGGKKSQRVSCYIKNFILELVVLGFDFHIRKPSKNQNKPLLMDNQNKSRSRRRSSGAI